MSVTIPAGAAALAERAYNPGVADIVVGTTVTWTNADAVAHTSTANQTAWNSNTIAPGARFSFKYDTAGTFPYHCAIHPGMVGTVVVR